MGLHGRHAPRWPSLHCRRPLLQSYSSLSLSSSLFPARGKAYAVYIPPTTSLNDDSCLRFYFYLFIYSHQKDATVIERKRCISTSGRNGCTSYYFVMQKRPSIYIIWERRKIIFREKLPRWTKRRRSNDRRVVLKKKNKRKQEVKVEKKEANNLHPSLNLRKIQRGERNRSDQIQRRGIGSVGATSGTR